MNKHEELIDKYNANTIEEKELIELERLIESGEVDLTLLNDITKVQQLMPTMEHHEVSATTDENFYTMLASESAKVKQKEEIFSGVTSWWNRLWQSNYQWAYTIVLLLVGVLGGYFWSTKSASSIEVQTLTAEVQEMKELMMLTMIEKKSTTDRLKAVSLTTDMVTVSEKVSSALLLVLKTDENTNVRLAAVESLAQFVNEPTVRQELVLAIKFQESPLVQLALAELMVSINEKTSIKEFEIIIENENTPKEVKQELQSAMQALV